MGVLDLVFPRKCLGCGRAGDYLCRKCLAKAGRAKPRCPECGYYAFGGKTHRSCGRSWGLDGVIIIWNYEGVVRKAILKMKYNFVSEIADELGQAMVNELKNNPFELGQVVVLPVPLYRGRERWRGFNQAEEVGRRVAEGMGWKFGNGWLVRKKKTKTQVGLKGEERRENVRGAFEKSPDLISRNDSDIFYCSSNRVALCASYYENASSIASESTLLNINKIVIFDDVWTTGATIKECAKVLKRGGFKEVWGLTIAA